MDAPENKKVIDHNATQIEPVKLICLQNNNRVSNIQLQYDENDATVAIIEQRSSGKQIIKYKNQEYYLTTSDDTFDYWKCLSSLNCSATLKLARDTPRTVFSIGYHVCQRDVVNLCGDVSESEAEPHIMAEVEDEYRRPKANSNVPEKDSKSIEDLSVDNVNYVEENNCTENMTDCDQDINATFVFEQSNNVLVSANAEGKCSEQANFWKQEGPTQSVYSMHNISHKSYADDDPAVTDCSEEINNKCDMEEFFTIKDESVEVVDQMDIKREWSDCEDIIKMVTDFDDNNQDLILEDGKFLETKENVSVNKNWNSRCTIESTSINGSFTYCRVCYKAFYWGCYFDTTRLQKTTVVNWKCSQREQGCKAEISVFLRSKCFLQLVEHTCRPVVKPQFVHRKVLLIEQCCAYGVPGTFQRREILAKYVPIKNIINSIINYLGYQFQNQTEKMANNVPELDPADPTTIMYFFGEKKKKIALYMGYEYIIEREHGNKLLICKHRFCPGKMQVFQSNKAIAEIHSHSCDKLEDSENVASVSRSIECKHSDSLEKYVSVDVIDNRGLDIEAQKRATDINPNDPTIMMLYHNEVRQTLVVYMGYHYVPQVLYNRKNEWLCRYFGRCLALLKISKDNDAVLRIREHSCNGTVDSAQPKTIRTTNYEKYRSVKVVSYLHLGKLMPSEKKLPWNNIMFPVVYYNGKKCRQMYHMGYEYSTQQSCNPRLWSCIQYPTCFCKLNISSDNLIVRTGKHSCKGSSVFAENAEAKLVAHASLKGQGRYTGTFLDLPAKEDKVIPTLNFKDTCIILYYLNQVGEKIAIYRGAEYVFVCTLQEYTEWKCKETCRVILRISSDELMAAKIGQHICEHRKSSRKFTNIRNKSVVETDDVAVHADTIKEEEMVIDIKYEELEANTKATSDIIYASNQLSVASSITNYSKLRKVIVLNYSTDFHPVAPEEQKHFQTLANDCGDPQIVFRGFKHTLKLESGNYLTSQCRCLEAEASKCEGAVLWNNNSVVAFVEHSCDKSNKNVPELDPNDTVCLLLYNGGPEGRAMAKYHGFTYKLSVMRIQMSMWHCEETDNCNARIKLFPFTKRLELLSEHICRIESTIRKETALHDEELMDYAFRVFPKFEDSGVIPLFNIELQPRLMHDGFVYSPEQVHSTWLCIIQNEKNKCSGRISFAENKVELLLKHTCLFTCRRQKVMYIFKGIQSSRYGLYRSYIYRRKDVFHSENTTFTWQCLSGICGGFLTTFKGVVVGEINHRCRQDGTDVNQHQPKENEVSTKPDLDRTYSITKHPIFLKAENKAYIFYYGHIYQRQSNEDIHWPCIHKETFGCAGYIRFASVTTSIIKSMSRHNCFNRSRKCENMMVIHFQQEGLQGNSFVYFKGYLYKRGRLLNKMQEVYKWNCMMAACGGVLTTKFSEVIRESAHECRQIVEENRIKVEGASETECIVLSDDSDTESSAKRFKIESKTQDNNACTEIETISNLM